MTKSFFTTKTDFWDFFIRNIFQLYVIIGSSAMNAGGIYFFFLKMKHADREVRTNSVFPFVDFTKYIKVLEFS